MGNILGGAMRLMQLAAKPAAPAAGSTNLYFKSDNLLYRQGSDGVEYPVDTGAVTATPAYRGEWATQDGQSAASGSWTGRFGWQSGWIGGGLLTGPAPVGILDSNNGANPGEFIVQNAGYYQVNVWMTFSSNATGYRQARLLINGTVYTTWAGAVSTNVNSVGGSAVVRCNAGDVLRPEGFQNSGAGLIWQATYDRNVLTIASCGQGPKGDPGGSTYTPNPVMDVWSTNSSNITTATWTVVTGWSLSSGSTTTYGTISSGTMTMTIPGMYAVNGWLTWASATGGRRIIGIYKNGNEVSRQDLGLAGSGTVLTNNVSVFVPLAVNDTLAVMAWQNSGGNVALSGTAPPGGLALGGHHWQLWKMSDAQTYA